MTESDVMPFLTHEWRLTTEIARDLYEAEGRRGTLEAARLRANRELRRMEGRGEVESFTVRARGSPAMWRLAE